MASIGLIRTYANLVYYGHLTIGEVPTNYVVEVQTLINTYENDPITDRYVHPATHPPSIIVQDSNNRFVTDAEKATWNAGGEAVYVHPVTHPPSIIAQNSTNRFVTDTEKATWNTGSSIVTTTTDGLMIASDKLKLNGLSNYTHPTNHPPSIIAQDTNNRFVTDAQLAKLTAVKTMTTGTGNPTGGADGDVYFQYV